MSYFIVRCLCPHYEDYDPIGMERNAVQGWPALWEPERYAEGGLYEEFRAMREQAAMMRRYAKMRPVSAEGSVFVRALVSIARDNGWRVKNQRTAEALGIRPVFTIPPEPDADEMPKRWIDIVRWMDRQKTREEEAEAEAKREAEEREAKRRHDNHIIIDYAALVEMMEGMMPDGVDVVREGPLPQYNRVKHESAIIQALVELADEGEWKQNSPSGFRGPVPPQVYRIR